MGATGQKSWSPQSHHCCPHTSSFKDPGYHKDAQWALWFTEEATPARRDWQEGSVAMRRLLFSVKVGGGPEKRSHIFRTNVPKSASRSPSESNEEPAGGSR